MDLELLLNLVRSETRPTSETSSRHPSRTANAKPFSKGSVQMQTTSQRRLQSQRIRFLFRRRLETQATQFRKSRETLPVVVRLRLRKVCKKSNQRIENSLRTINTTRWHTEREENPRSTSTPCLTSKLSRQTGQPTKLNRDRRSRSFSFILSPQPSPLLSRPVHGE